MEGAQALGALLVSPRGGEKDLLIGRKEKSRISVEYVSNELGMGRECVGYLVWIIRHYHHLPQWVAFTHGHKPYESLNFVFRKYFNKPTAKTFVQFSGVVVHRCFDERNDKCCFFKKDFYEVLEDLQLPMANCTTTDCCASFVVHRSRILQRPLFFYLYLLRYVLIPRSEPMRWPYNNCYHLEHYWHVIFGEKAHMFGLKEGVQLTADGIIADYDYLEELPESVDRLGIYVHTWT